MISLFDVYEYLPHTDCGKCIAGSCMNMAKAVSQGKCRVTECTVINEGDPDYAELFRLIEEESDED